MEISKSKKISSIVLKAIVLLAAIFGTILSAIAGRNSFMGGTFVFMYFTIQSNILIAIVAALGLYFLLKNKCNKTWIVFKFVSTISITLTFAVFWIVLAPAMAAAAWTLPNVLTHLISPLAAIIDLFVVGDNNMLKPIHILFSPIPPILYAIYAGIGFALNWEFAPGINYPYFFLNWGSPLGAFGFGKELPFMGCAWWILILLVFLLITSYVFILLIRLFRRIFK
ncbi:MAG: Pr6Pr family membrane protein [Clostridia bacterium]|nr:Pr6Pr family membrane protein [Clostridia bacterium]